MRRLNLFLWGMGLLLSCSLAHAQGTTKSSNAPNPGSMTPAEKSAWIKANPEAYKAAGGQQGRTNRTAVQPTQPGTGARIISLTPSPTGKVKVDNAAVEAKPQAQPVVEEQATVEPVVVAKPRTAEKSQYRTTMTRAELESATPEKRAYIQDHPGDYDIIDN